jgi:hypothetical protein
VRRRKEDLDVASKFDDCTRIEQGVGLDASAGNTLMSSAYERGIFREPECARAQERGHQRRMTFTY